MSKALRFNQGKPEYSLLDLNALEPAVRVLEFGAIKYDRDNWKKGFPISKVLDSLMRHISALQRGEWLDPESGLPHIGHIQCNAIFLGCKNNTIDIMIEKEKVNQYSAEKAHKALVEKYCTVIGTLSDGTKVYDERELWENHGGEEFYKPEYQEEYAKLVDYYWAFHTLKML